MTKSRIIRFTATAVSSASAVSGGAETGHCEAKAERDTEGKIREDADIDKSSCDCETSVGDLDSSAAVERADLGSAKRGLHS